MSNATATDLRIVLTDAQPVDVTAAEWPVVAEARSWDNTYEFQANRIWTLKVRQHADGRCIVYGVYETSYRDDRWARAGEIVDSIEEAIGATHRVGDHLDFPDYLADECIGDLPAVELVSV